MAGTRDYFWEHAPTRAFRWARERFNAAGQVGSVIGAIVQLGRCFDLLDESFTSILADRYGRLAQGFAEEGRSLPRNRGKVGKRRELDCLVINYSLDTLRGQGVEFDTVRGAFLEGAPVYYGAGFARESHIQVAVRNSACIAGSVSATVTNMMSKFPTPEELAAEAWAALRRMPPKSSHEVFTELVRKGWINARGQVTKLLGGEADPEPNYETWTDEKTDGRKKERRRKK
jgi:hypothetical protein